MRIKNIIAILTTATLITMPCFAENDSSNPFYIKAGGGFGKAQNFNNKDLCEHDFTASKFGNMYGDIGYKITDDISVELGADYIPSIDYKAETAVQKKTIEFNLNNILAIKLGAYYNYDFGNDLGLYIGVGGGPRFISGKMNDQKLNIPTSYFVNGEIGVSYSFSDSLSAMVGYNFKFYEHKDFNIIAHGAKIGLKYSF
jgi:hypothetical protein